MTQKINYLGIISILAVFLVATLIHPLQSPYTISSYGIDKVTETKFDHSYAIYKELLEKYVVNAKVNYEGFFSSRAELERFLKSLGNVEEADFESWTEDQRLAFWINAYNAFTIKAIVDHYPIKRSFSLAGIFYAPSNSILQIKGVWTKLQFRAAGKMVTLDEIEHQILRKKFNDPRIHMAIVCASVSCPDLRDEPYVASRLEEQLSDASTNFVNNPDKGFYLNEGEGKVKLSKIFKWFGDDFIPNYASRNLFNNYSLKENAVLNFASDYLESNRTKEFLKNNKLKVGYLKYDWHLNEMKTYTEPSSS